MPTLGDIQNLVDKAREEIRNRNFDCVKTGIWPSIKTDLGQCADLKWEYRGNMAKLIYKHLNEQNLQGEQPAPIQLVPLKAALEAGSVHVPEPAQVYRWLPW